MILPTDPIFVCNSKQTLFGLIVCLNTQFTVFKIHFPFIVKNYIPNKSTKLFLYLCFVPFQYLVSLWLNCFLFVWFGLVLFVFVYRDFDFVSFTGALWIFNDQINVLIVNFCKDNFRLVLRNKADMF